MANKSNAATAKRKGQNSSSKAKEKATTPHDDIESLQITFYEIESWIEKTTPVLTRMTKELEKASGNFDKRRKENQQKAATSALSQTSQQQQQQQQQQQMQMQMQIQKSLDTRNLEQQLLQFQHQHQQQPLPWNRTLLNGNITDESPPPSTVTNDPMKWILSFQPGNLLRLDTNITSVEQLIQAVQKIRLLQSEEAGPSNSTSTASTTTLALAEDDDMALELLCSSPSSSSTDQAPDAYVEYWQYALGRRPKICLENYKHCQMNLNGLTKDISPAALNYMGQVFWDCLHPKFSSDWNSFWDRSGDPKRNQVCIDSGLAMVFLHVMRHDKDICVNSQEIAGFYFDRAREELMEFFDETPDCSTIEALLNLSMFCIVCKRYSQARIFVGLCLHMVMECDILKLATDDLILRKKYLKLLLILYYNDSTLSVYVGDPPLISDTEFDINFYEIITLNDTLFELNKTIDIKDRIDFDHGKTIVKESYFVHTVELVRLTKKTNQLIKRGATVKQLLAEETVLEAWYKRLPEIFKPQNYNYEQLEQLKLKKDMEKDLFTSLDAKTLQAQASLLLKIQYDSQWIILHKAILNSIRRSTTAGSSPSLSGQERRSSTICSNSADSIVKISEVITRSFGWCVCQQIITCLYHASTVYCGNALIKDDLQLKNRAKIMIHKIMRILEACRVIYAGFPDDMTDCLCEFLKNHGMHNSLECSCKSGEETSPPDLAMADIKEEDENTLLASLFNHSHDFT